LAIRADRDTSARRRIGARRPGEARIGIGAAADAEHHVAAADRVGEELVVGGQRLQRLGDASRQDRHLGGHRRGREAIGLGKEEVQADRRRLALRDARDELGHARARPRPLAVVRDRVLVDDDHRDRLGGALEREHPLVAVEHRGAQRVGGERREQQEKRERGEQHQGENPQASQRAQRSISSPS